MMDTSRIAAGTTARYSPVVVSFNRHKVWNIRNASTSRRRSRTFDTHVRAFRGVLIKTKLPVAGVVVLVHLGIGTVSVELIFRSRKNLREGNQSGSQVAVTNRIFSPAQCRGLAGWRPPGSGVLRSSSPVTHEKSTRCKQV